MKIIANVIIWLDILFNKKAYVRCMLDNGFLVGPCTTRQEIYLFWRLS